MAKTEMMFDHATLMAYAIRREDGSADIATTVAKFEAQMSRMVALRETEETTIALHVDRLYDSHPVKGAYLPSGWVVGQVLTSMGTKSDTFTIMQERVEEYLSDHGSHSLESNSMFHIKKGKGYARRRDLKPAV